MIQLPQDDFDELCQKANNADHLKRALHLACEEALELMYFRPPTDEQRQKMYDHFMEQAKEDR
jgi:hypothetical protein